MLTDAILNQSEPNVILTAHLTKVNRTEPNWTEPQTCLAGRNHAFSTNASARDACIDADATRRQHVNNRITPSGPQFDDIRDLSSEAHSTRCS